MVIHRTGMTGKELDKIAEIWLTANLEAHSFINKGIIGCQTMLRLRNSWVKRSCLSQPKGKRLPAF
ncbi:hypothetical protein [Lentilactobacillus hilgardii]|uniref:hypothetical protein n=1 Tax=Lentilactobacillus hilgardii TaxID=1588 RepID=UPI0021A710E6|nr:hypothetical protein [Lentilactobacillus hilgardii]